MSVVDEDNPPKLEPPKIEEVPEEEAPPKTEPEEGVIVAPPKTEVVEAVEAPPNKGVDGFVEAVTEVVTGVTEILLDIDTIDGTETGFVDATDPEELLVSPNAGVAGVAGLLAILETVTAEDATEVVKPPKTEVFPALTTEAEVPPNTGGLAKK